MERLPQRFAASASQADAALGRFAAFLLR